MTTLTKFAQNKLIQNKLVQSLEKKLPFEVKEEALKEIAKNVIERARQIREGLKKDPVGTVKNYRSLLDVQTLAPTKGKKSAKKTASKKPVRKSAKGSKATTPKKALRKATLRKAASKSKKAIH